MASRSVPWPTSLDMRWASASHVAASAARLSGSTPPVSSLTIRPSRLATAVPVIPVTLSWSARISASRASSTTCGFPLAVLQLLLPSAGRPPPPAVRLVLSYLYSTVNDRGLLGSVGHRASVRAGPEHPDRREVPAAWRLRGAWGRRTFLAAAWQAGDGPVVHCVVRCHDDGLAGRQ